MTIKCPPAPDRSASGLAYALAAGLLKHINAVTFHARDFEPVRARADFWRLPCVAVAPALLVWLKLSDLLTTAVKTEARAASWPNQVEFKFGDQPPAASVLEAVAAMGEHLRFVLYLAREGEPTNAGVSGPRLEASGALAVGDGSVGHREPLSREEFEQLLKPTDRDAVFTRHGMRGDAEAELFLRRLWLALGPERATFAISVLTFPGVDFESVAMQLTIEAAKVEANRPPELEFRPTGWFKGKCGKWLRAAAAPTRIRRKVRAKLVDGEPLYCVEDVAVWRPQALPDP
jgi:hypothetical protein